MAIREDEGKDGADIGNGCVFEAPRTHPPVDLMMELFFRQTGEVKVGAFAPPLRGRRRRTLSSPVCRNHAPP